MSLTPLTKQVRHWQNQGEIVVLVTGVFDLLHIEHVRFLTKAKSAGSKLIVGIESDQRVAQIKGIMRPVNSQSLRLELLQALKAVDTAFILPAQFNSQQDWESFMETIRPDIYAVSSHTSFQENKRKICEKYDITFQVVHPFNPDISTTQIIETIMDLEKD